MDKLIELERVTVHSQQLAALEELSVVFPKGRSTVIMGPSGSGKSMLLKVAAGIVPPDSGSVYLNGRNLEKLSRSQNLRFRRTSGFMFQDGALWANKSVFENLALPLQFHFPKLGAARIEAKVRSLVEPTNLLAALGYRPASLSMGERKFVSFLRAVILDPSILFLDEPTPSMDHVMVERMLRMIKALRQKGCSIIAVTHDAHLTAMVADHLVVLKQGRVLETGDLVEVRGSRNPEVVEILSQVLSEAATYDTDILDLLEE
jgi:phospholipid/cholesterol/gamma-HCH transport system ATP-binding protein